MEDDLSKTTIQLQNEDKARNRIAYAPCPEGIHFTILNAAYKGNLDELKQLGSALARSVTDIRDEKCRGALHFAASGGRLNICKYLIEELRGYVDIKDEDGHTPLSYAAIKGHLINVKYLLKKGAAPDIENEANFTPLHFAAKSGNTEILASLLLEGVRVDVITRSGTALHYAASLGHHNAVKLLLDYKAKPNQMLDGILTPLEISVVVDSLPCVKLLVEAGKNPNFGMPLVPAASMGRLKITDFLLKAGANPNFKDEDGRMPIELAAIAGNREIVDLLLPFTSSISKYSKWSPDEIIRHLHSEDEIRKRKLDDDKKVPRLKKCGNCAFGRGDYISALYYYTKGLAIDPNHVGLLSNRSFCWTRLNEGDNALRDAQACVKHKPNWPKAYYRLGSALYVLKMYDKAADAFSEGLKRDPRNEDIIDMLRKASEARDNLTKERKGGHKKDDTT